MTDSTSHEETRSVAAELALGVATGAERGRALAHLEECRECRQLVTGLAEAKDEVLLLAPEREPSAGFETRTLAHLTRLTRPARGVRWRRILSLSVAAAVAAGAVGGWAWLATSADRRAAEQLRTALSRADGKYLGVEVLRRPDGVRVGHVAVYLGHPSWIFAVIDQGHPVGTFEVEIVGRSGDRRSAGTVAIDAARRGGGLVLPPGLGPVAAIVLIPQEGGDPLEGRLPTGDG